MKRTKGVLVLLLTMVMVVSGAGIANANVGFASRQPAFCQNANGRFAYCTFAGEYCNFAGYCVREAAGTAGATTQRAARNRGGANGCCR